MATQISETATKFLGDNLTRGRAIPGQSLTNNPDEPQAWERPPEFTEVRKAMYEIFEILTEKENLANSLLSLSKGVSVIDISSIILYTGFIEGKWNPDLMMLLMEPTMYMVMALADKAEIDYVMDSARATNEEEMSPDKQLDRLNDSITSLQELRRQAADNVSPMAVTPNIKEELEEITISESLLAKVKKETNNSLLSKEE
tara:strand:+ start:219 stop:821 length:603 start_codon:yes stop_codon:yes gene_type:complete